MVVYECLGCGFKIGDSNGKLDPMRYMYPVLNVDTPIGNIEKQQVLKN